MLQHLPRTGKSFRFVRACVRAEYPMSFRRKNLQVAAFIFYLLSRRVLSFISRKLTERSHKRVLNESSNREFSKESFRKRVLKRELTQRVLNESSKRVLKGELSTESSQNIAHTEFSTDNCKKKCSNQVSNIVLE